MVVVDNGSVVNDEMTFVVVMTFRVISRNFFQGKTWVVETELSSRVCGVSSHPHSKYKNVGVARNNCCLFNMLHALTSYLMKFSCRRI